MFVFSVLDFTLRVYLDCHEHPENLRFELLGGDTEESLEWPQQNGESAIGEYETGQLIIEVQDADWTGVLAATDPIGELPQRPYNELMLGFEVYTPDDREISVGAVQFFLRSSLGRHAELRCLSAGVYCERAGFEWSHTDDLPEVIPAGCDQEDAELLLWGAIPE